MGGNRQKKSSFSFMSIFKAKSKSRRSDEDTWWEDSLRAYKVYPSDQDRAGRVVADVGIDRKAAAYIDSTTNKWNHLDFSN